MIWSYFPVGLSYPVDDFSEQTKRRCWEVTLSALMAAEQENRVETWFFDFCAHGYPGSSDKEYVCILNQRHVTQTRITVPMFREMGLLRAQLSFHYPFYGANALDDFGPYVCLGEVSKDGVYSIADEGKGILPDELPAAMVKNTGSRILIAMNAAPTEKGYSEAVRSVALKAAEAGMRVDICPIANGGIGTAYAVTCAKEGRFEWLKGRKIPAYLKDVLLGILPGHTVIWDCAALNAVNGQPESTDLFGEALKAIMDLGYRNIVFAVDGFSDQGSVSNFILEKTDPRLIDCSFTVLTSNAAMINGKIVSKGTVWELIRMGASLRYAPEYVSEALRLPERGKAADKILLEQDPVPGVTSVFRSVFGDQKCTIIPSGSQDPDELDRLFE